VPQHEIDYKGAIHYDSILSVHCYNLSSVPYGTRIVCAHARQLTSVFYSLLTE